MRMSRYFAPRSKRFVGFPAKLPVFAARSGSFVVCVPTSRTFAPEFGELRGLRADVADLRTEFGELRAEVSENRGQIVDLRERLARVETGLEQVQANQVRMLDILERGPQPRG